MEPATAGQPLLPQYPPLIQRDVTTPRTIAIASSCPRAMARPGAWSIQDYSLTKQLYRGKASALYLATCRTSGQQVVLKAYSKRRLSNLNWYQVDREIRLHSSMEHENIIALLASFEDKEHVYMVQEYAAGGDLFEDLKRSGGQYKERQVARNVLPPFLAALQYLHGKSIIHRDIKPENILLTADKVLKMADFGLSINSAEERPVTRAGTLDYMSPEVLRCPEKSLPEENKEKVLLTCTDKVDVWAVGILTYELLVGRPPFEKESREETYQYIMNESPSFPSWMSEGARDFINCALAKNARKRPSVLELLRHPWLQLHMRRPSAPHRAAAGLEMSLEDVKLGSEQHRASTHGATTARDMVQQQGDAGSRSASPLPPAAAAAALTTAPSFSIEVAASVLAGAPPVGSQENPKAMPAAAAQLAAKPFGSVPGSEKVGAGPAQSGSSSSEVGSGDSGQHWKLAAVPQSPFVAPIQAEEAAPANPAPQPTGGASSLDHQSLSISPRNAVTAAQAYQGSFMELYKNLAAPNDKGATSSTLASALTPAAVAATTCSDGRTGSTSNKAAGGVDTLLPPLQPHGVLARPRTSSFRRVISQPALHTEPLATLPTLPPLQREGSRASNASSPATTPRAQVGPSSADLCSNSGSPTAAAAADAASLATILESTSSTAEVVSANPVPTYVVVNLEDPQSTCSALASPAEPAAAAAAAAPAAAEEALLTAVGSGPTSLTAPSIPQPIKQPEASGGQPAVLLHSLKTKLVDPHKDGHATPVSGAINAQNSRAGSPAVNHDSVERMREAERKHIEKMKAQRAGAGGHAVHAVDVESDARLSGRGTPKDKGTGGGSGSKAGSSSTAGGSLARTAETLLAKLLGKREPSKPAAGGSAGRPAARPQTAAIGRVKPSTGSASNLGLISRAKSDVAALRSASSSTAASSSVVSGVSPPKMPPTSSPARAQVPLPKSAGARHAGLTAMQVYTVTDSDVLRARPGKKGVGGLAGRSGQSLQSSGGSITLRTPSYMAHTGQQLQSGGGTAASGAVEAQAEQETEESGQSPVHGGAVGVQEEGVAADFVSPRQLSSGRHVQFTQGANAGDTGLKLGAAHLRTLLGGTEPEPEGLIAAHKASPAASPFDSFVTASSSLSASHTSKGRGPQGSQGSSSSYGSPLSSRKSSMLAASQHGLGHRKPTHQAGAGRHQALSSPGDKGHAAGAAASGGDVGDDNGEQIVQRSAASWSPSPAPHGRAGAPSAALEPRLRMYHQLQAAYGVRAAATAGTKLPGSSGGRL